MCPASGIGNHADGFASPGPRNGRTPAGSIGDVIQTLTPVLKFRPTETSTSPPCQMSELRPTASIGKIPLRSFNQLGWRGTKTQSQAQADSKELMPANALNLLASSGILGSLSGKPSPSLSTTV